MNGLTSSELKAKTALIPTKDKNKVVRIFTILSLGLSLSLLVNFTLTINNFLLARKQKIYVEQENGSTKIAQEKDRNYRSESVIRQTVTNWLYLNWEWDGRIPNSEQLDPGIHLKEAPKMKVLTIVYLASYFIEAGFRTEFLKEMSALIPKSVYLGNATSNLTIYHLGTPTRIDDTTYQIKVIATRTELSESGESAHTKFNKVFTLKTIEPYRLLLGENEPSAFRKQLNELLKNGLMIANIE